MRIVVLAGGLSTEREVSISSGTLVAEALRSKGHEVVLLDVFMGYEENICDIDALFKQNYSFTDGNSIGDDVENTITNIKEAKENRLDKTSRYIGRNVIEICAEADITFLALHGGEGENGQLQATLDLFGIKYTGSGYLGSALAMNKGLTKSMKNMAYRSMDVQEATVRMTDAHESFRMDNAICELSADVRYKYHGIFLCFVNLLDGADNEYTIKNKAKYSYYGR